MCCEFVPCSVLCCSFQSYGLESLAHLNVVCPSSHLIAGHTRRRRYSSDEPLQVTTHPCKWPGKLSIWHSGNDTWMLNTSYTKVPTEHDPDVVIYTSHHYNYSPCDPFPTLYKDGHFTRGFPQIFLVLSILANCSDHCMVSGILTSFAYIQCIVYYSERISIWSSGERNSSVLWFIFLVLHIFPGTARIVGFSRQKQGSSNSGWRKKDMYTAQSIRQGSLNWR